MVEPGGNPVSSTDDGQSPEERLTDAAALMAGVLEAADVLFSKLDAYHALIEDELEQVPGAYGDLERCRSLIERMRRILGALQYATGAAAATGEALDLRKILEGVSRRAARVLPHGASLRFPELDADEDIVVRGSLFHVQDLLMEAALAVGHASGRLVITAIRTRIASRLQALVPEVGSGEAALIRFGAEEARESQWEDLMLLSEAVFECDTPLDEAGKFLRLVGMARTAGGSVLASTAGRPLDIVVVLPLDLEAEAMRSGDELGAMNVVGHETILLVDDEETIWDVIIDMLQELGYSVILAADGREAVEIYRENPGAIDLVILDMLMPELDGVRTFEEIRRLDPESRILLSSGYVSEKDVEDLLRRGAAGFLPKPYRMVDLAVKLRQILDGQPAGGTHQA